MVTGSVSRPLFDGPSFVLDSATFVLVSSQSPTLRTLVNDSVSRPDKTATVEISQSCQSIITIYLLTSSLSLDVKRTDSNQKVTQFYYRCHPSSLQRK